MVKRTFKLSYGILEKMDDISDYFHINKATLARFAIYHGIERVKNGYIPVRDHHKKQKKKYEISLPEETWLEFFEMMDSIRYKVEEHIPDGEMIEIFLSIELRKFMNIIEYHESNVEDDTLYDLSKSELFEVQAEIPSLLYKRLKSEQRKVGIMSTQLGKYILISGAIQEYVQQDFDTVDTDVDLLNEIDKLGLNKLKALTLIRYLIASNRIIWKSRK